jgi:hypothetical protein
MDNILDNLEYDRTLYEDPSEVNDSATSPSSVYYYLLMTVANL